jgi:hypothetical protein
MGVEKTAKSRFATKARWLAALFVMAATLMGGAGSASAQQVSVPG